MKYFLSLLSLWITSIVASEDKLLLAQAVFRHGARAPVSLFSSKEAEHYFWRGLGQLTDEGVKQAYELGKALRIRLVETGFLDKRHNPNEIFFHSSPATRCMITASTVGAAMFDPIEGSLPNIIGIQTEPKSSNHLTVPQTSKSIVAEMREVIGAPANVTTAEDAMEWYIMQLAPNSTHFQQKGRMELIEALLVEKPKGLAVASWFNDEAEKEAKVFLSQSMQLYSGTGDFYHEKWIKCRSGFLLNTMMENFKEKALCRTNCSRIKFYAYSSHDLMVQPILQSLGIYGQALQGGVVPYTATVLLELWQPKDPKNEPYVKVLWRTPGASFISLTSFVPGCVDDNCPLSNFTSCCTNFMTSSPQTECSASGRLFSWVVVLIGIFCYSREELL